MRGQNRRRRLTFVNLSKVLLIVTALCLTYFNVRIGDGADLSITTGIIQQPVSSPEGEKDKAKMKDAIEGPVGVVGEMGVAPLWSTNTNASSKIIHQDRGGDDDDYNTENKDGQSKEQDGDEEHTKEEIIVQKEITINEENITKTIQPGNHTNIPNPESRLGPNGESSYVHDPKFLWRDERVNKKNQNFVFDIPTDEIDKVCLPPGQGDELPQGAKNLQNIRSHIESLSTPSLQSPNGTEIKLFCAIYTHARNTGKTNIISQTWGPKCDGILYASDVSNSTTGHIHLPSNSVHGFEYKSITQRVRAMFAYIYDNFLDEYDYFHFCGDDVFMIVENMKEFLSSSKVQKWEKGGVNGDEEKNEEQYFIAGFWMHWWNFFPVGEFYLGGGSGYTLSKKALKAYVEGPLQTCNPYEDESSEDIYFARCVREGLTSKFIDTRDEFGAHQYHQFNISMHSEWPGEKNWGVEMNKIIWYSLDHMEKQFGFPFVTKENYVSNSSITFHRHTQNYNLLRMEMLLYRDWEDECNTYFDNKTDMS